MNVRLLLATTATACSLLATSAYAGSPFYDTTPVPTQKSMHAAPVPADSEYRATASEDNTGAAPAAAASSTPSVLGADGYPRVEATPQYYNHAQGTMGAP